MDIKRMLADLTAERDRIEKAITALQDLDRSPSANSTPTRQTPAKTAAKSAGRKRHMSAAARKRISDMMRQRWAERKKRAKA